MLRTLVGRLSYANVIATLALFVALGGGAYAVSTAPKNSVVSRSIKDGQVRDNDLATGAVTSAKVLGDSLTGGSIDESSLQGIDADKLDGLDSSELQKRISQACESGKAVGSVNQDGTVGCVDTGGAPSGTAGGELTGTYPNPGISPSAVIRNQTSSAQSGGLFVNGTIRTTGLLRTGSETTGQPLSINNSPGAYGGVVVRRVQSTNTIAGSAIARTDDMTLERDGTDAGLRFSWTGDGVVRVAACTGVTYAGPAGPVVKPFVLNVPTPNASGTTAAYSNTDDMATVDCQFGNSFSAGHTTVVHLVRQQSDNWMVGYVISTFNQ